MRFARSLDLRLIGGRCLAAAVLALLAGGAAHAQYRIDAWTSEQGLPQNSVNSIVQTYDGYLWLGTLSGIVRFDGVRFTLVDERMPGALLSNRIMALHADRPGSMWIGTAWGGLTHLDGGRFTTYTVKDGLPSESVYGIARDREGRLWLSMREGLVRYEGGRFTTYTVNTGLPGHPTSQVIQDRRGDLWFGTGAGLVRYDGRQFTTYTTSAGLLDDFVEEVQEFRDGSLWVATHRGVAKFDGRAVVATFTKDDGLPSNFTTRLLEDRAGNVWIGTDDGLGLLAAGAPPAGAHAGRSRPIVAFTTKDGLSDGRIAALAEDREGDIWAGTRIGGLDRIKRGNLTAVGRADGLPGDGVVPVVEDAEGAIWIGMTCGGLARLQDGVVRSYGTKDGLPNLCVWSLLPSHDGSLWVGTWGGGLARLRNGRFTTYPPFTSGLSSEAVLALHETKDGALWIGTTNGLNRLENGVFTVFRRKDGLVSDHVQFITEDREGALWLGSTGGLTRMKDGVFRRYTTADGLSHSFVRAVHQTADGTIWLGTYGGGLNRLKDGRFTVFTTRDGLFENVVSRIIEDDRGNFWMTGNKGISRVRRADLDALADGRVRTVTSVAYGVRDGMLSSECNGGGQPAGWRARDGRLWCPTARGVVTIDPRGVPEQAAPPPIVIEDVRVDQRSHDPAGEVVVPPGAGDLEIRYTGLSFSAPEYVRFKYRLDGLDHDWTDAGGRRTANFSHLPPGRYTFTVAAASRDGGWSERGATVRLRVVPPFYRTFWFQTVSLLLLAGLVLAVYEWRLKRLREAQEARESFSTALIASQERERQRIAAELHDSLGQHLLIIKNRALLGVRAANGDGVVKAQLDEIGASATAAIDEVRHIAYDLRPFHLDRLGLTSTIEAMVERVAGATGTTFDVEIDALDGVLAKDAEINLYRIVQESVNNIAKHARASRARIRIARERDALTIGIEDDGAGFAADGHKGPAGPRRGLGLGGIAERVRILGGTHHVRSAPGHGTTISIRLPLPHARE